MKRPVLVFLILSLLFNLSMFYRVSSGVIAPKLMADLHLDAESLGVLGGAFFYSFALLQIPMGPLLDRVGPHIIMPVCSLIGALGSIVFGLATSYGTAVSGRILMGVGMASMLMGAFKVFTLAFRKESFSTLIGLFMSAGTIGNMLAASPFAYLAETVGWRMTFVWTGAFTGLLGVVALLLLKPLSAGMGGPAQTGRHISFRESARLILGSLSFWQISVASFFRYGTFVSLQAVWLGLYLMQIKGFTPVQAGNVLIALAIGNAVGGPVGGRAIDGTRLTEKQVTFAGLAFYCLSLLLLTGIWEWQQLEAYLAIAFSLGFFHAVGTLLHAHAKALYPLSIAGTAMAWVNFCVMAGAAILTTAFGRLIEFFPRTGASYPPAAYHFCFLIGFVVVAASVVFYAFSPSKPKPSGT